MEHNLSLDGCKLNKVKLSPIKSNKIINEKFDTNKLEFKETCIEHQREYEALCITCKQ